MLYLDMFSASLIKMNLKVFTSSFYAILLMKDLVGTVYFWVVGENCMHRILNQFQTDWDRLSKEGFHREKGLLVTMPYKER